MMDLQLTPLQNNIAVCCCMILYFKLAIEFACWMRLRFQRNLARPVLHMLFTSTVIFWPHFDSSEWSWRLNALVPAVMVSRMIHKGVFVRDPSDPDVQNLSLSSSPSDLLFGPLFLAGIMVWLGTYQFMKAEATIIAAACFGDSLAPMIGSRFGRHLYRMPTSRIKTLEGCLCVFLGTVCACYFYLYFTGMALLPLRLILAYAGIAAVAEGTAPANLDNLVIVTVLHFSMEKVETLLPA